MTRRKSFIFTTLFSIFAGIFLLVGIVVLVFEFIGRVKTSVKSEFFLEPTIGNVLYINSYDHSYVVSKQQLKGVEEAATNAHIFYEVNYMDTLNYDSQENYKLFYQSLKNKINIRKKKYDAVVVSDDAALGFVEEFQHELFEGVPIVFFGINDINHAHEVVKNPYIIGFPEYIFVKETLETIVEQNPRLSKIICISDDSITGRGDCKQFVEAMDVYPNIDYEILTITNLSKQELSNKLFQVSSDSVILCLSSLQSYAHANSLTAYELVELITLSAKNIPVYRTNAVGVGAGFVGGKLYDHYKAAKKAVETVKQILRGQSISDLSLKVGDEGVYVFDYSVLKKNKLSMNSVPKGAVFINKPETFFTVYKNILIPFFLICLALLLMLGVYVANYTKSKRINSVMMIMNKRMRLTNKELVDSKTKLTYVANVDALTGLPNRAHGEAEIRKIIHSGVPFSLFLMDIDDFKNYNDTYTHACGDMVLREFGQRLSKLTANNEYFAARYGGDEFIVVHRCGHIERNGDEIEFIKNLLNSPLEYNGITLDITVSLGYVDSDPDLSYDDLLANADIAMYQAKNQGNGVIVAFTSDMKESIVRKNKIVEILREECAEGGFEILYQPQVSAVSGEVYGYEALVRLQNYPIGPNEFIPVAEDSGYITQIGRIVAEKVLKQMNKWRSDGMPLKKVAINYSNGQLVDDEYVSYLKNLMDKYEIPPEKVEIEITESLFMGKKDRAQHLFDDLADIGVGLALDDFGTGYSSLSYLTFVPAKKVKIDKTLVDNYLVDGKEDFILNIVQLVHGLGMKLTVEGVEHKWQYDKLCKMKCDYIQGYFFSKPMTADAVPQFTVAV